MANSWQEFQDMIKTSWEKFKAFLRDKLVEKEDFSNLEINRDYSKESDIEDLRQDTHNKIEFDIAIDKYVSNRMKSLQKGRNNKFRKENSIER